MNFYRCDFSFSRRYEERQKQELLQELYTASAKCTFQKNQPSAEAMIDANNAPGLVDKIQRYLSSLLVYGQNHQRPEQALGHDE